MPLQPAYRALSDPTRREILWLLHTEPRRRAELIRWIDVPPSSIDRHLVLLTAVGLVQMVGEVYVLRAAALSDVVLELAELAGMDRAGLIDPVREG